MRHLSGHSAFAHKGGTHVNALLKWSDSYQHIDPELVGNSQRILVSELAGRSNLLSKVEEFGLDGRLSNEQLKTVMQHIKKLENQGFQFEGAEASVELMLRRAEEGYTPPLRLGRFLRDGGKPRWHPQRRALGGNGQSPCWRADHAYGCGRKRTGERVGSGTEERRSSRSSHRSHASN